MTTLPMTFSDWWPHYRPYSLEDHHFGLALHPEHLPPTSVYKNASREIPPPAMPLHRVHSVEHLNRQPWWDKLIHHKSHNLDHLPTIRDDKEKFQVILDVQQFAPDEITVKVADDHIIVEGNHKEKGDDHGWVQRSFRRRYEVPEYCDLDKIQSKISSDGILIIRVPHQKLELEGERIIPVKKTFEPAFLIHEDMRG